MTMRIKTVISYLFNAFSPVSSSNVSSSNPRYNTPSIKKKSEIGNLSTTKDEIGTNKRLDALRENISTDGILQQFVDKNVFLTCCILLPCNTLSIILSQCCVHTTLTLTCKKSLLFILHYSLFTIWQLLLHILHKKYQIYCIYHKNISAINYNCNNKMK